MKGKKVLFEMLYFSASMLQTHDEVVIPAQVEAGGASGVEQLPNPPRIFTCCGPLMQKGAAKNKFMKISS